MPGWLLERSNGTRADDLVRSTLYNERTFYSAFMTDLENARQEVIIESPFITCARTEEFLPVFEQLKRRGVRIVVNTRHPDERENERSRLEAIRMVTNMQVLGVRVLYTGKLHRKIAIIDNHLLYEGSLNILSQHDICELMRRVDSPSVANEALNFMMLSHFV